MSDILGGILAFCLYYLYDINTVYTRRHLGTYFFAAGTVLLGFSSIHLIIRSAGAAPCVMSRLPWLIPAGLFFVLLIYTLFFALPVKQAYSGKISEDVKVYRKGVYALCRHPGVLWLSGFYICLAACFRVSEMTEAAVVFTVLDILYVILQDMIIFPKQFVDYTDYQRSTPFLIPTPASIMKAYSTFREEFSK